MTALAPGDRVRVRPSQPRRRDGFDGTVARLGVDPTVGPVAHIYGPHGWRVIPVGRLVRRRRQEVRP